MIFSTKVRLSVHSRKEKRIFLRLPRFFIHSLTMNSRLFRLGTAISFDGRSVLLHLEGIAIQKWSEICSWLSVRLNLSNFLCFIFHLQNVLLTLPRHL